MKSASHPAAPKHYTALSRETGPAITTAPEEPVLDIHDIQGNTIPGFNKPHQYILCFTIEDAGQAKQFLCEMLPHISTLEEVLAFRRLYRARKKRLGYKPKGELNATWLNIAFSYPGVCKLTTDNQFESEPFKIGLADRSPLLGDPTDPNNEGCPLNWIVGNKGKIPDTLILIGGDRQDDVRKRWLW